MVASPEASYTLAAVIDEALNCKKGNKRKNILFLLDANNNLDLTSFKDFVEGAIEDQPFLEERVEAALKQLPEVTER